MTRRSSIRSTIAVVSASMALTGLCGPAPAKALSGSLGTEPFAELAALPDQALEGQRGGVRINGIDMDIAIRIETRINDRLQMVSTLLADANERINRRTEVLANRLDPLASSAPVASGQKREPIGQPAASSVRSTPPVAPRTVSDPQPAASRTAEATRPTHATVTSAPAATTGAIDRPALSVRHILEGALGTRIINRLNGQRIVNRIEMTVTLRNYETIRQQAQRIRVLSTALRAAAARR